MANVNLYTKFDFTDADGNLYSDGSTTTAKTITVTNGEIFDRTYVVESGTSNLKQILNNDLIASFDFLYIESNTAAEIQLVCNEGGTTGSSNLENGFCIKLNAGVPFVLHNDDSRNQAGSASNINTWESNWTADTIDRIEYIQETGSPSKVRVVAIG